MKNEKSESLVINDSDFLFFVEHKLYLAKITIFLLKRNR